ncbi:hypothetical protein DL98DRAFT_576196 [Cadophora sp. DSE1049]|nr:hypothetical protein DL98DRAFT_576196 [Cadophora sp. DSE1049]
MAGTRSLISNVKKMASRKSSLSDPAGDENAANTSLSSQTNGGDTGHPSNLPGQTDGADAGNETFAIPSGSSGDNTESSSTVSSAHRNWSKHRYALPPSEEMAERVATHHSLIRQITGFLIHPKIEPSLPTDAKIADLNTGTGVFLHHLLGDSKKQNYTLVGYDTMPDIFPGRSKASVDVCLSKVIFKEHDILHPYPEQDQESFDSVHTNFLGPVLISGQWDIAFNNMVNLAKPGGWIQWIDVNLSSRENRGRIYVSKPGSSKASYLEMMKGIAELDKYYEDETSGGKRLREIALAHPEVKYVHEDVFNTAQLNDVRVRIDKLSVLAWRRLLEHLTTLPIPNNRWTQERVDRIVEGLAKEVEDGVYIPLEVYVVVAQKHDRHRLKSLRSERRLQTAELAYRVAERAFVAAQLDLAEAQRAVASLEVELPCNGAGPSEELYHAEDTS